MTKKYRYGHKFERGRKKRAVFVISVTVLIAMGLLAFIFRDISSNKVTEVAGESRIVSQMFDTDKTIVIDEPFFSMELPQDWKETDRKSNPRENSITWQATKKNKDNRYLTLHIDKIPKSRAVNKLLPLAAQGNGVSYGQLSENCSTFTEGGTLDAREASQTSPTQAKWQDVEFVCNLPGFVDNEVGTSSKDGVNTVKVTGSSGQAHEYMFIYTDRNVQPDYTIFYNALNSFRAK